MTTASTATVVDHTSDAGFRAWASEVSTQLAAIGLVQTADTGQINLVTVTRPGTSTAGGYQIWRFADSTLYMKIEYGTGTSATAPQMWITVGTGSNGTGTLTGQLSTRNIFTSNSAPTSTATLYTSRWCRIADAFSFHWKEGFASAGVVSGGLLVIGKTVDGTGAATTTGFAVLRAATATGPCLQSVRTAATAVTFNEGGIANSPLMVFPGNPSASTTTGGNSQAYTMFIPTPDVQPFCWAAGVLNTELPRDTTMSVAMVGATTHTFCGTGQFQSTPFTGYNVVATYGIAFIYE
jgi:hypothetical protein